MTNKQRILHMVERWPEDISFDQAAYHMYVMRNIMEGIKSAENGEGVDHDELFDELERLCDEEEKSNLVSLGQSTASGDPQTHRRSRRPKNGQVVRKSPKKVRKHSA